MTGRGRPRSITLFTLAWLIQTAITLFLGLADLPGFRVMLSAWMPGVIWEDPALCVALFVRAGIALLPLWLILARRAVFARWAATVMMAGRLWFMPDAIRAAFQGNTAAIIWMAGTLLAIAAIWLLFRSDSNYWFASARKRRGRDAQVLG